MSQKHFTSPVSEHIWTSKYRYRGNGIIHDKDLDDTWSRVATAVASVEEHEQKYWQQEFYNALADFKFLPGGRILAGAGTDRQVTLFNCFVMGAIEDSMDGIFQALHEGAITMQQGGGVGVDFSTLRPQGARAHNVGTIASGPVSFMRIWDSMCATLLSTGSRRGAMMATLRCDHPDIELFIEAKSDARELRHFNLSVLVTDAFLQAVEQDEDWPLVFPAFADEHATDSLNRVWSGQSEPAPCRIYRMVSARKLWDHIMHATYEYAEPGVLFIDAINKKNNLWYREQISATNPCGEIPLPSYGACVLGSINLTRFVRDPFTDKASIDLDAISQITNKATRFLDNVIDLSRFPLEEQKLQATGTRRIGLGITGLADTLIMLGQTYDSPDARKHAQIIMQTISHTAYLASVNLAQEKGVFPFLDLEKYLQASFIRTLPLDIQEKIKLHGIRNSHLITIAPAGTISLLANNISSGLEPVFDFEYQRKILDADGSYTKHTLTDYAYNQWLTIKQSSSKPDYFVDARKISPQAHLEMEAALAGHVDNAISKTINIPEDYPFEDFNGLYLKAAKLGLKGCTTFRENPVTGAILSELTDPQSHCCNMERVDD